VVLLLPGPTDSCVSCRPIPDRLPTGVRAIAVSQRGHGDSDKPPAGSRVGDFAADVIDASFARSFVVDASSDEIDAELLDDLVDEVLKVPARVWRETFAGMLHYDDLSDLGQMRVPTLLVWGDEDRLVPRAMQDELAARIPKADLVVYPGVGHTPRWDDSSRFAADLAAFARRRRDQAG
jgi:pimeloyl-ACP methyl ester carboxylesterase